MSTINNVVQLRLAGLSTKDISKKLNITRQCVWKYLDIDAHRYCKEIFSSSIRIGSIHLGGRDRTRFIVRKRDNFTCQNCGDVRTPEDSIKTKKRQFDVHHLNGLCGKKSRKYDSMKSINMLITLCHKCHFNHPEHSRM